jgi:putative hydroxymethylpyrimidine transport system substrate-binding protein
MSKLIRLVVSVAIVAALLSGCGTDGNGESNGGGSSSQAAETIAEPLPAAQQDRSFWIAMDGWDTAETIAFPIAEARDYFSKYQFEILTLSPVTPKLSIPDVVKGQDAFGIVNAPEAVIARDRGAPIVIVGSFVRKPTAAIIWPKESGIGVLADLKGKTVAIPGLAFQKDFLGVALERAGLTLDDVKVKTVGNNLVPALLHGRADAIFGGSANVEGATLREEGVDPVVTPVASFGAPAYEELVFVAREKWAAENPQSVRDLLSALARGAAAAVANPKNATETLEADGERDPRISPQARAVEVKETLPLLSTTLVPAPGRAQELIDWMHEEGMIQTKFPASELLASPRAAGS